MAGSTAGWKRLLSWEVLNPGRPRGCRPSQLLPDSWCSISARMGCPTPWRRVRVCPSSSPPSSDWLDLDAGYEHGERVSATTPATLSSAPGRKRRVCLRPVQEEGSFPSRVRAGFPWRRLRDVNPGRVEVDGVLRRNRIDGPSSALTDRNLADSRGDAAPE